MYYIRLYLPIFEFYCVIFFQDLNRDFPSWYDKQDLEKNETSIKALAEIRQLETQLLMTWILEHPFVLSANFHDGAVLANVS